MDNDHTLRITELEYIRRELEKSFTHENIENRQIKELAKLVYRLSDIVYELNTDLARFNIEDK